MHPNGTPELDHPAADRARPDDSERLAAKVGEVQLCPAASTKLGRLVGQLPSGGEHKSQGMFGYDVRGPAGNIRHDDPQFAGGLKINRVGADPDDRDEPQFAQLAQMLARPLHRTSRVDQYGGIGQSADLFGVVMRAIPVEYDITVRAQAVQVR